MNLFFPSTPCPRQSVFRSSIPLFVIFYLKYKLKLLFVYSCIIPKKKNFFKTEIRVPNYVWKLIGMFVL